MSVSQIISASPPPAASTQPVSVPSPERQIQKDINALGKALNADDTAGAQNAASQLQEKVQNISPASTNGQNQIANAVQDVSNALKSGNVADAKKAFAVVQQVQQNKIDQKNNVSTRELVSKPVPPPSSNSAISSSIGRNIDTKA